MIRPATPSDFPLILPMVAKTCALHESWDSDKFGLVPNPEQRYEKFLQRLTTSNGASAPDGSLRGVLLVAEEEPQHLVGFIVATIEKEIPIYRLEEFGFIQEIWVEAEYRQAGVGRQLVMQAMERLKMMGVKQIRLDTAAVNDVARRLFTSCGFRVSTVEMLINITPS
ncbi:MAG: GNAT family N-acetyltransferase [Stigonema ocellatum SAG 48.90 = DSM 106950]|nr:GNAT family N-acetyltransferase [Stigonema ocellatum SAG 48.90 = DSM 106950]